MAQIPNNTNIKDVINTINSLSDSISKITASNIKITDVIKIKASFKIMSFYLNEIISLFNKYDFKNLSNLNKNVKSISDVISNIESINNILSNVKKYNRNKLKILTNIVFDLYEFIDVLGKERQKLASFNTVSTTIIESIRALNTIIVLLTTLGGLSGSGVGLYKSFKWNLLADTLIDIVKVMSFMILMVPIMTTFIVLSPIIFLSMKLFMFFVRFTLNTVMDKLKFFGIKQYINLEMALNMIQNVLMEVAWLSIKVILITPLILIAAIMSPILFGSIYILFWAIRGIIYSINVVPLRLIFATIGKLTIISVLLLAVGATVMLFAMQAVQVIENWKEVLIFFGIVVAYIGAILLIGGLLTLGGPLITAAIAGLGATLLAITIFSLIALQLLMIQNIGLDSNNIRTVVTGIKNIVNDIINILFADVSEPKSKESGFFNSLVGVFGKSIIGFTKTVLAIPVLVATVVSVGIISFIAMQLRMLQTLNLNGVSIQKNVSSVLEVARMITNILFAPTTNPTEHKSKSWFQSVVDRGLDWFTGKQFAPLIQSILAVGTLAMSFISTTLILLMATELRLLQNLNLDSSQIHSNVSKVLTTSQEISRMLFDPIMVAQETAGQVWWKDCLNWGYKNIPGLSHIGELLGAVLAVGQLALTTISVSLILFMATELRMLQSMNLNSDNIRSKVNNVLGTAQSVISSLWDGTYDLPQSNKSFSRKLLEFCLPGPLTKMVDAISTIGMIGPLMISIKMFSVIAEELKKISKYENIGTDKSKIIVNNVLSDAQSIINCFDDSKLKFNSNTIKKAKLLQDFTGTLAGFTKNINLSDHTKLTENTIKIIDKVNTTKLENLRTAYNMFKEMKEFSQTISGNFEGLADALNEKIAPLLEELKELMSKIPEAVDKSASTVSGSVHSAAAWQSGTATQSQVAEQVARENPSMTKEEINKVVDQRMVEQTQTVNKGIEMKLEELMEILQNYSNPVPVRLT